MKNVKTARINWATFRNIPCNSDDEIEEEFLHFPIGTNKFTIWKWFGEEHKCSVVDNLWGTEHEENQSTNQAGK